MTAIRVADLTREPQLKEKIGRIVGERNKVALRVMREQIAQGKKFIGIFYGAGHLKLMEKSLKETGFHKVGVTWRTAWDIAPPTPQPATRPSQRF